MAIIPRISIRPANTADASQMSAIVHSFSHEFLVSPGSAQAVRFLENTDTDRFAEQIRSGDRLFFVAADAGRVIGFISVRDGSHVTQFFVVTEYHRQGVGRQLWQRMQDTVLAVSGAHTLTVRSSLRAVPVYERFGFIRTAGRTEHDGLVFVSMTLTILSRPP